ncbi:hypothetical protein A3C20_03535 [Candidatus Kaiserbacteria bacterium RIFCSPHIGHO2_02_FULL_55_25]|uniref:Uncharacterized protein n=1 Tax=Candidatus Kaiserbacteria bacterium RIFCSPHIGHO2_02_FULL_55_25 TaxID=1798498 RepID=A0A1F6E5Y7_9BACT|nr:MAG: hypothetical protein A3C20_03535 [Candidatus Kaiserbacteria bacterium RIFCSPHIGHO2_02_FULL_55_25]
MTLKDFYNREKHVALNAQPRNFRIAKWIVIVLVAGVVYAWKGLAAVGIFLLVCAALGTSLHFFLRWKTDAWTKSWGPYKRIRLDGESLEAET